MDDANRPWRAPLPRDDEPRMTRPAATGDMLGDGYWIKARRPRVAGFYDFCEPDRADRIEGIVSDFEASSMDYDD